MRMLGRLTLAAFVAGFIPQAGAEDLVCTVTSVSSGYIFLIDNNGTEELAALEGITCPWTSSSVGAAAKAFTTERILGKRVRVTILERLDKLSHVELHLPDGADLAELLLKEGLAQWDRKWGPRAERYHQLEREARERKVGLWAPEEKPQPEARPAQPAPTPLPQPGPMQPSTTSSASGVLDDVLNPLSSGTGSLVLKGKYQKDYSIPSPDNPAVLAERERKRKERERALMQGGSPVTQQGRTAEQQRGGVGGFGGGRGRR